MKSKKVKKSINDLKKNELSKEQKSVLAGLRTVGSGSSIKPNGSDSFLGHDVLN